MRYGGDVHSLSTVVNLVQHAVVADAKTVRLLTVQFLDAKRAGLSFQ